MLQILGRKPPTVRNQCGGNNRCIIKRYAVALGDRSGTIMCRYRQSFNRANRTNFSQKFGDVVPRHVQLAPRDVSNFIQNLYADDGVPVYVLLGPIGLGFVGR